jgi:hypothetical protein
MALLVDLDVQVALVVIKSILIMVVLVLAGWQVDWLAHRLAGLLAGWLVGFVW